MFCTKCGVKNDDNSRYCYSCGNQLKLTEYQNPTTFEPDIDMERNESTYWENQPDSTPIQQTYHQEQQETSSNQQTTSQTFRQVQEAPNLSQPGSPQLTGVGIQQSKSIKPFIIIIPIVAVIAIIILVGVIVSRSNNGVLDNILSAAAGTLEAGSLEFEAEGYNIDKYGSDSGKIDGIIEYDFDKEKLNFNIGTDDERAILYDGIAYEIESERVEYADDISRDLKYIFEYYSDYKKALNGLSSIDWEEAVDEIGIPINIDEELLQKCLKEFEKNMNDKIYLESVCNKFEIKKTSEGTIYSFDVDVPEFVEALADTFDPLLKEYKLDNYLPYIFEELDVFDEFKIDIIIKNDKLVGFNADIAVDHEYGRESIGIELTVDNYGKASLDMDEIEEYIEEYEDSNNW